MVVRPGRRSPSRRAPAPTCRACGSVAPLEARFCPRCGRTLSPPPRSVPGAPATRVATGGDRRPVTVLFLDIVGSTALLEMMDPEDWRAIVNDAFARLTPAIRRYDGTIAQYLGDGLLAYFGAPVAHEDDTVRAALAALDLLEAARAYGGEVEATTGISFEVRIGLDTGEVIAGALGGDGASEYLAVGDAVNTAARLQAVAEPMTVLASERCARTLEDGFVLEDRGPFAFKGLAGLQRASRIASPVAPSRMRPGVPCLDVPLVGRSAELRRLDAVIDVARTGRSMAVAILGEPGIGKSRLLTEWRTAARHSGVRWAEAQAISYGGETTHHLLAMLLRALAGAADDATPAPFLRFVEATLGPTAVTAGAILADIPWPGSQATGPTDPRGLLLARRLALRSLVDALAADGPLVLVLEDVHRADPASVAVLETLLATSATQRILAVTSRPEPASPGWPLIEAIRALPAGDGQTVELAALDPDESRRLVEELLPGAPAPPEVAATVWRRAEGNPLFAEQLVRSLVEQGALRRDDDRWSTTAFLDREAIPSTVQGLLLARIDRLAPEERAAIHVGAVIGRQFSRTLLARVATAVHVAVPADLGSMERAGLVRRAAGTVDVYAFQHALVQEASYASQLRADRVRLHGAVARALCALQPDRLGELAPVLAFHYRRAGELGPAIRHALVAGHQARVAHANAEALAAYDDVLAMLVELPEGSRRARRRVEREAHERRGDVLAWLQRREEALAAYGTAEALLPRGASLDRARLAHERGIVLMTAQRVEEALEALRIADRILGGEPPADRRARDEWVHLHLTRATLGYFMGDLASEERDLDLIGPWVEAEGSLEQQATYLSDRNTLALRRDRFRLGDGDMARERRALELASQLGDPASASVREFSLGLCLLLRDELAEVDRHLDRALAVAEACQDELLVARIRAYRPLLALKRGDLETCRARTTEALEAATALRLPEYVALAIAHQAWIAWRDGHRALVRDRAREAVALWDGLAYPYPFRWIGLLPVLALDVEDGDPDGAVRAARAVLHPAQQRLPEALEGALRSAVEAWDGGDPGATTRALEGSIATARSLGYL